VPSAAKSTEMQEVYKDTATVSIQGPSNLHGALERAQKPWLLSMQADKTKFEKSSYTRSIVLYRAISQLTSQKLM